MKAFLRLGVPFAVIVISAGLLGCPKYLPPEKETSRAALLSLRNPGVLWVDFAYAGGNSDGTEARPFTTLTAALNAAQAGDTIRILGNSGDSSSPETGSFATPVRIEAAGGPVQVGFPANGTHVPGIVGLARAAAESTIVAAGLAIGAASQQYHATVPQGHVMSQNPAAGAIAILGSSVAMVISDGPAPAPPTIVSFQIGKSETTTSRGVLLRSTCSGSPTHYMASESSAFTGASWQVYSAAPSFVLSSGNGVKSVYFKVKNAGGQSLPAVDTITLGEPATVTEETVLLPGDIPLVMVYIPAGTFMMGRYTGESDSQESEDPRHEVTLSSGFWIGKYELTKGQWGALMGTAPWTGDEYVLDNPNSPAVDVTWDMARDFIASLSAHTGLVFRLPSEAEWEYACRAGEGGRFYWGDDLSYAQIGNNAWYYANTVGEGQSYAHVFGMHNENEYGLNEMSGNVAEWCEDDWHWNYTGAPADGHAWVDSPRSQFRVLRGGSWIRDASYCRSAARSNFYSFDPSSCVGFRVCR